ncbi:MAG TPA: histidine phosphatase family protein [Acidimicrobiia bacterium]|nr:histidine phosphatase family protein [Acidimicrobiia bacterium]
MTGQPYPKRDSRKEIVFIRHAESQANADGVWNGRNDGPLSEKGEETLEYLGRRLRSWDFDAVVSSPLSRARRTAEAFADDVRIADDLIEIDLGNWEDMSYADVLDRHGDELRQALATRTVPMGEFGESIEQAGERAITAVDRLFDEMGEDERIAVVTHGGLMQAILHRHLAGDGRRVHGLVDNTGITRIVEQFGRPRLASFNDTGHLGPRPSAVERHLADGERVVALVRHGRTQANLEGRWQGRGDWDLDELGHRQAEALGEWYGRHATVYTSPLKRAASTAAHVALNGVISVDDLMEIHMGDWEGMTTDEISTKWARDMKKIYRDGIDLPRGTTGETWSQLTQRFSAAIHALEHPEDDLTVVVAHGGAIRSYVSSLTKTTDTHSQSLFTPANTSVTHIAMTQRGPEILDFSVSTHLESLV